jgi:hypothetical protein
MQRVAGWDFDHRLNGYITTAADRFSCDCGQEFDTPSGYRKCGSCGRAWNSYVIGTDNHGKEASLEKVICREIPVRKDVIVASKRRQAENEFGFAFDKPKKKRDNASLFAEDQDEEGTLDKVSRHLRQAKDCKCWDGYCRVPGTKPCAKGSCEKCDGHREARRYVAWCRLVGRMPSTAGMRRFRTAERIVRQADKHNLRRRDLKELENPDEDEQNMSIEHFSSRRRAELFDITDEGETPMGKGKSNTPMMRKNPAGWTKHKQNGQFTKRWN